MRFSLRPYQAEAVEKLRAAYRHGKRAPLLQLATGGGKTIIYCFIGQSTVTRGKRVLILVHRQELLLQSSRALDGLGVRHGLIAPGHSLTSDPIQIASVQTLARRIKKEDGRRMLAGFDLAVIDECHHTVAKAWMEILAAMPRARILGVTATPCRLDNKGLGAVFDTLVRGPSIAELIRLGYLVPPVVYAPPTAIDLKGVRSRGGDYVRTELAAAVDKPTITGDAVDHYRRLCPGVPALAFCTSIRHAEHVAAEFSAAGVRASPIDGTMPDGQRQGLIRALADGRIKMLTSCDIISEGTDIPVVGAAILLRPTQSMVLVRQQVGRALRPAPGKEEAIILDHVGNILRHGMPDHEPEWSLEQGYERAAKGAPAGPPVRQCPSCYAVHAPAPACPACGHAHAVKERRIEQAPGELQRVDPKVLAKERERTIRKKEMGAARTREDLEALARRRGYRRGWVDHVIRYREQRQGERRTSP